MARLQRLGLWAMATYLLLIVSGAAFNGFHAKWGFRDGVSANSLRSYLDGTTMRPFAYRRLLPDIANAVDEATPARLRERLAAKLDRPDGGTWLPIDRSLHAQHVYTYRFMVFYAMSFASAALMTLAAYLFSRSQGFTQVQAALASGVFTLFFPITQSKGGFFYDFSEAAFLFTFLALAARGRVGWMLCVSAVATWNKESFLLFVPTAYPFLREHFPGRARTLVPIAACMVLAAAVYAIQQLRFSLNPGTSAEFHLPEQLAYFVNPRFLLSWTMAYGFPMPHPLNAIALASGWLLWRLARPRLPAAALPHLRIAAAINVPLFLVFGFPGEVRNLSFLFPSLVLLLSAAAPSVTAPVMVARAED